MFDCFWLSVPVQLIAWKDSSPNDLLCVEWDVNPTHSLSHFTCLVTVLQIPFFPMVKKDLTFIHLGNDSVVEELVNFEKLRMIAKEVRRICDMAPVCCVSLHWKCTCCLCKC